MIGASLLTIVLLLAWATVCGVDLVSFPQAMLSRPIVAGSVAGWIAGDLEAGLRVGVLLELFALDVLAVGAVKYPDYGAASVGAAVASAGAPWELSIGVSAGIGLLLGAFGGWSLLVLRRLNTRAIERAGSEFRSGGFATIRRLHLSAIARDLVRSLVLGGVALTTAWLVVRYLRLDRETATALTLAAVGAGVASAIGGAVRGAGTNSPRVRWLAAGGVAGLATAAAAWTFR